MNDILKLNGIIEKHFSETELSKISRLSTTNKCESLHQNMFTFAPKSTIYTRNFAGLCHSAVHSSSLGNGITCINLTKIIGLKYKRTDPFIQQMEKAIPSTEETPLAKRLAGTNVHGSLLDAIKETEY